MREERRYGDARTTHVARAVGTSVAVSLLLACGGPRAGGGHEAGRAPEPERIGVGYGTQRADRVSGAVAVLRREELDASGATRVEELMLGRIAGVEVTPRADGSYSIHVRGRQSLLGDDEPLIVLDGMALAPGFDALRGVAPQDVARIEVLKDAAGAIYGSRGANGVIIITTRRR